MRKFEFLTWHTLILDSLVVPCKESLNCFFLHCFTSVRKIVYSTINNVIDITVFYKPGTENPRLERRKIISIFTDIEDIFPQVMSELTILIDKHACEINDKADIHVLFSKED
ncbi:MAG: hypothetical protein ACTSP4_15770 [Candidatus Hodarchaeales archaeon]